LVVRAGGKGAPSSHCGSPFELDLFVLVSFFFPFFFFFFWQY
jgi:hypothetical protein